MLLKHLENKIKLVGLVCSLCVGACVIICLGTFFIARGMVSDAHKKVYVLDSNRTPITANQSTMEETIDVEAKSHIEMFHNYFFTLAPDEKFIKSQQKKAMNLIDESGLAQLNVLRENNFFSKIIATSTVINIFCDSINFNKEKMQFTYYGRQRLERRTDVTYRQLITAGEIRRVPRTENNPHGLLICNWRTLLNKDLEHIVKRNY